MGGRLVQRLSELRWVVGSTIAKYRWAEGRNDRFAEFATEFVRLKVDAIVTAGTPSVLALMQATSSIPIVLVAVGDPVANGITVLVTFASLSYALAEPGDASRGQEDFRACAPCHSLEPDRNMTGPSLANLWGHKAGSLPSFDRYSDALKSSGIIWDDRALDGWLTDPQRMVPDNEMPFEGINDALVRADLLAFVKDATKPGATPERAAQAQMKGMGGMMGGGPDPNLKNLEPARRVKAITCCRDTCRVTTADDKTRAFWERNLRFVTDSSKDVPEKGAPAIMPAGMMGDRVDHRQPADL